MKNWGIWFTHLEKKSDTVKSLWPYFCLSTGSNEYSKSIELHSFLN
jgi:hypothetical protein